MAIYRIIKPLAGIPVGETAVVTIPIGATVETIANHIRRKIGLKTIWWDGNRLTVFVQDLRSNSAEVSDPVSG